MDIKSDMALGINTKNKEWMKKEVYRMNRGIYTIDEKLEHIKERRLNYNCQGLEYLRRLGKTEAILSLERIKCRAKIELLEKMLK
jgi:hypothetical protein